mgnify:CR=1 FL=1
MRSVPEYYVIADGRVWCVSSAAWVADDNAEYQAWLAAGHAAGRAPDADGQCSAAGLHDALTFYGLPLGALATAAEMGAVIRAERDKRIGATDYLLMPDYPLAAESLAAVKTYRQALRDLPAQEGFPWAGEISAVPWPAMPTI